MRKFFSFTRLSRMAVVALMSLVATLGVLSAPSPALASGCGDVSESQWTGLVASTWTGEAFINGVPNPVAVVLTNIGNEAVLTFTDSLKVYIGQYDWDQNGWDMAWYGVTSPYDKRYTIFVDGATCGLNNRVTWAVGETWTYEDGQVGTFTMSRVV